MKTIIIFTLLIICIFSNGCQKKDVVNQEITKLPSMETKFGFTYLKQGWLNIWFYPFSRQDTMPYDSLKVHDRLAIQIEEKNIQGNDTTHSLPFRIIFRTLNDIEERHKNLTTDDKYEVFSQKTTTNVWTYKGIFNIPCKFKTVSIPGNDTLEISPNYDKIIMNFVSTLSNLSVRDTIILKP